MAKLILPIVLQLAGAGVIIAEFILPSGGLLTVAAVGVFGYSLFHVFRFISPQAGMFFVAGDVILIPAAVLVGIKLLARSSVTLNTSLSRESGVSSQDSSLVSLVGKPGTALTSLRPAGKAVVEGKRYDVVSGGDFIDKNTPLTVIRVDGNRIVVRAGTD